MFWQNIEAEDIKDVLIFIYLLDCLNIHNLEWFMAFNFPIRVFILRMIFIKNICKLSNWILSHAGNSNLIVFYVKKMLQVKQ